MTERPMPDRRETVRQRVNIIGNDVSDITARIFKYSIPVTESGCWLWLGGCAGDGYGVVRTEGKNEYAHRVSYQIFKGEIQAGLHIDHLCKVHCCVNPDHLEPVTCRENLVRGEGFVGKQVRQRLCLRGHELAGANLKLTKRGERICLECRRAYDQARIRKKTYNPEWYAQNRERIRAYQKEYVKNRKRNGKSSETKMDK